MTPSDRKPARVSSSSGGIRALAPERCVDPGVNSKNPERVSGSSLTPPVPPKGRGPFADYPQGVVRSK
jgi:hypothetical protein